MLSTNFIAATKEYSTYETHIPAPYLRKTFSPRTGVTEAKLTVCGLGFYEFFLNGKRMTKGLLAPYISNPDDMLYYDTYDLTEQLLAGKNALCFLLGNGMLNCPGGTVWDFQKVRYRSAPKVAFALELTYENGETECITADESVRVHPSPILFDDLRCGEIYDANQEIAGWNLPDFDDSAWGYAIPAETPRGQAKLCTAEPIALHRVLRPVSIEPGISLVLGGFHPDLAQNTSGPLPIPTEEQTGYLYDFGVNLAGNIRLKISGKKGQRIAMTFGEVRDGDGNLDMRGMGFQPHALNHRVIYTLKGDGVEEYAPTFTYQGFRYVLVAGLTAEQATEELLTYEVMASDLCKNGDFSCSDDVVNRLQAATYNSDLANFYYFPTDCPHREKNGWTADAALSAEQMLFNLTPENSYRVWLENIRQAQRIDGALPGIIPTGGWGFQWGNGPAWDCVLFYLPYYTWLQRGNTDIILENAGAMMRYLHYISNRRDDKGLLHIGLGDWLPIKYKLDMAPLEVTDTLVTMNICLLAAKMFDAIGMTVQKQFAEGLFAELRTAARTHLLLADGVTVLGRTQTGQAMAIEYGLLEEGEKAAAFDVLLQLIHESDDHLDSGVLGARIIFHVLARYGYADLAYRMITRPDYPSYGFWVLSQDATTLFEDFRAPDEQPASRNHHFFGDISSWFFKWITGVKINPHAKDVHELEISPNFIEGLEYAEGYQNHLGGQIGCAWKRAGDTVELTLTVPEGCYGYLLPPAGYLLYDGDNAPRDLEKLIVGTNAYRFRAK